MERALVVVEGTEATKAIVRQAAEITDGIGAELILLHVTSEDEFADRADALARIPDFDVDYGVKRAIDGAQQFADDIGREVVGDAVEFKAVGRIGDGADAILAEADRLDADHVFISGPKRSPAGKALFGDTTQQVILGFEGPVTVLTA